MPKNNDIHQTNKTIKVLNIIHSYTALTMTTLYKFITLSNHA